ncbi:MAG: epoxyqueuosine reductase QueH [Dysgonamonadaceae bacterium]|jgi:predicted adenine nucleotide alpha hydrolase (AANH) superfamily ATPase|nr:epoxyqueuosine reductase QueH [Dysgonamonadaceae bacterium]
MLLLHVCCAPCSAAVIEWLLNKDIRPALFFFNPNIYPKDEYERRKDELMRYAKTLEIDFIDGDYDHESWLQAIKGLENQPERGFRCLECFKLRLFAAAKLADEKGFTKITTTLASSRWKKIDQIATAGKWATAHFPAVEFWDKNWRKDGLSERRKILLQENGFYNQRYCGCEFSLNSTNK